MHTATRLALPVIDRVRTLNPAGDALRLRALRATERVAAARARRVRRARRRGRAGPRRRRRSLARTASRLQSSIGPAAAARFHHARPIHAAAAGSLCDAADARRLAARRRVRPTRRAAANTAAGTVRSCRSTTASSASCPSTSCSPTSISRSPPAPRTSRSAIPTSSTAPRTRAGSSRRCTRGTRTLTLRRRRSRSSICLQHRELLPVLARHRLPVRDQRGRSGGRRASWSGSRRATRAPTSSTARRSLPRRRTVAGRRRSSRSRRGRRSKATATCSRRSRRSIWSSMWRRCSGGCACSSRRARGCSSSTTSARRTGAFDPRTLTYPWPHAIRASTRCSGHHAAGRRAHDRAAPRSSTEVCALAAGRARARHVRSPRPPAINGDDPVSRRTLVLLSGAQCRAGGSGLKQVRWVRQVRQVH